MSLDILSILVRKILPKLGRALCAQLSRKDVHLSSSSQILAFSKSLLSLVMSRYLTVHLLGILYKLDKVHRLSGKISHLFKYSWRPEGFENTSILFRIMGMSFKYL